jgi:hypothetical protein
MALGQEQVTAGFEMPLTISGGAFVTERTQQEPREGSLLTGGSRAVAYPTIRLNQNWFFSGAVQFHSRPYFFQEFETQGYGAEVDVLQAYAGYERFWGRNYLSVRAGQLSSAFGSFLLRYDDAVNPLVDVPASYGYYGAPITNLGLVGAQVDATINRLDLRAQFTNSSPANRRSISDSDQYGAWTGGIGYTIRQGFRVGVSAHRGPYLHRGHRFYFPGELAPKDLPASAVGAEVEFARGHWNLRGEIHRAQNNYVAISNFRQVVGYGEAQYAFHPRWYLAGRINAARSNVRPDYERYEFALGYRPNRRQLVKVGYQLAHGQEQYGVFAVQLVTRLNTISTTWD